jgi:nucleotide-binding universal stress UspA family protein
VPEDDPYVDMVKRLGQLVEDEPSFKGLPVEPKVLRGDGAEILCEFLEEEKIDLLVIASHGHSAVKRFLLGSFAEKMLRVSSSPVLVFHEPHAGGEPPQGGAIKGFEPKRILVAHDFTAASRPALLFARDWARHFGASARLQFVAEQSASLYGYAAKMKGSFQEYLEKVRNEALDRFRRILQEEWKGVPAEAVAVLGDPAEEIQKAAREYGADLIVLGTQSRSSFERFFLGSVAQKTVRRSSCPVVTVRAR